MTLPVELYRPIVAHLAKEPEALKALSISSRCLGDEADIYLVASWTISDTPNVVRNCRRILNSKRLQTHIQRVVIGGHYINEEPLYALPRLIARTLLALSCIKTLEIDTNLDVLRVLAVKGNSTLTTHFPRLTHLRFQDSPNEGTLQFIRHHPSITSIYISPVHDQDGGAGDDSRSKQFRAFIRDPTVLPKLDSLNGGYEYAVAMASRPNYPGSKMLRLWFAPKDFLETLEPNLSTVRVLYLSKLDESLYVTIRILRRLTQIPDIRLYVLGRCSILLEEEDEAIGLISTLSLRGLSIRADDGTSRRAEPEQLAFIKRIHAADPHLRRVRFNQWHEFYDWERGQDGTWTTLPVLQHHDKPWEKDWELWREFWDEYGET